MVRIILIGSVLLFIAVLLVLLYCSLIVASREDEHLKNLSEKKMRKKGYFNHGKG